AVDDAGGHPRRVDAAAGARPVLVPGVEDAGAVAGGSREGEVSATLHRSPLPAFMCRRMNASAFSCASSASLRSPPASPWPAPRPVTSSCATFLLASSFAIAADWS